MKWVKNEAESTMPFSELQKYIHDNAVSKGFWSHAKDVPNVLAKLALIHSEVSEAVEDIRENGLTNLSYNTAKDPDKPCGLSSELADVVIRCMDLSEMLGIDLWSEIVKKHNYNLGRPAMHGGKLA